MDRCLILDSNSGITRNDIIRQYFNVGFSYLEIIAFLRKYHDEHISVRQLNRILRSMGLRRRNTRSYMHRVIDAINSELDTCGNTPGYR